MKNNSDLIKNGLLANLQKNSQEIEYDEKLKIVSEVTGYSPTTLKAQLNLSETEKPHAKGVKKILNKQNERKYWFWLTVLHYIFQVPVRVFGINPKTKAKDKSSFRYHFLKSLETNRNRIEEEEFRVVQIGGYSYNDRQTHFNDYEEVVINFIIEKATNSIEIYDYLERLTENRNSEVYAKRHSSIYEAIIEEKIEKKDDYIYTRYLALPVHIDLEAKKIDPSFSDADAKRIAFLKYSSNELFEHICTTINKFEKFSDPTELSGFYIVEACRTYSFAIANQDAYYLEELSRYVNDKCIPDIMIVGECNGRYKTGADLYIEDLRIYKDREHFKFTLENLTQLIEKYIEFLEKQLNEPPTNAQPNFKGITKSLISRLESKLEIVINL